MVYLKDHRKELSVLGAISEVTHIPPAFLSKILQKLTKRGLVAGVVFGLTLPAGLFETDERSIKA